MMKNGGGASDTTTHLAFLDLPCLSAMANKGFNLIGLDIGKWENQPHLKGEKPLTYDEYVALPSDQRPHTDIVVLFDMGWQKKGLVLLGELERNLRNMNAAKVMRKVARE
eukprot:13069781-Ditylum_brightwellii.AAC.1